MQINSVVSLHMYVRCSLWGLINIENAVMNSDHRAAIVEISNDFKIMTQKNSRIVLQISHGINLRSTAADVKK